MCKKFSITLNFTQKEIEDIVLKYAMQDLKSVLNASAFKTIKGNIITGKNNYTVVVEVDPENVPVEETPVPTTTTTENKEVVTTTPSNNVSSLLNTVKFMEPKKENTETVTYTPKMPSEDDINKFPLVGWGNDLKELYPNLVGNIPAPRAIDGKTYINIRMSGTEPEGVAKSSLLWFEGSDKRITDAVEEFWPNVQDGYKICDDTGNCGSPLVDEKEKLYMDYMSAYMRQHKDTNGFKMIYQPAIADTKQHNGHSVNAHRVIHATTSDGKVTEFLKLPTEKKLISLEVVNS